MTEFPQEVAADISLQDVRSTTGATTYGVVVGCPRSGTGYLMSLLNTAPGFECVKGKLLPITIPYLVNLDLPAPALPMLAIGFQRALDTYLESGVFHSRAAALKKWIAAPTGLQGFLRALRGDRDYPRRIRIRMAGAPGCQDCTHLPRWARCCQLTSLYV